MLQLVIPHKRCCLPFLQRLVACQWIIVAWLSRSRHRFQSGIVGAQQTIYHPFSSSNTTIAIANRRLGWIFLPARKKLRDQRCSSRSESSWKLKERNWREDDCCLDQDHVHNLCIREVFFYLACRSPWRILRGRLQLGIIWEICLPFLGLINSIRFNWI